jgi:exonuclease SbcC
MKILELRFQNLNSLYKEWSIDFTTPEYGSDGIFAITGPTGAGKSTILDAICLALYGRTPRLKTITKSSNEIMSRQTGECFAEVTFETMAGKFIAHWSQRRSRKQSDGNLQESKHEISDALTGQILESKKREVAARIEKTTGMDFDRFTRSMLLAQGGFAAFLTAPPNDKSPILEQITGTIIYSEISKQVHERKTFETKQLELLMAQTDGILILNDEEESLILKELSQKKQIEKTLGLKNENLGKSILWLEGIDVLKKEILVIDKESEESSARLIEFEKDRQKLVNAQKATELDHEHATLLTKRQQQNEDLKSLADSESRLPYQTKRLVTKEAGLKEFQTALIKIKEEQKNEHLLIKNVRALDQDIVKKQEILNIAQSDFKKITTDISKKKEELQNVKTAQALANKNLLKVEAYVSANANDGKLMSHLTGITEQIKNLLVSSSHMSKIQGQVLELKKRSETTKTLHEKQTVFFNTIKEKHEISQEQVARIKKAMKELLKDRLLREYRTEYDTLLREIAYRTNIASLEEKRNKLDDDTPCPLCGSLDHPFARENVPWVGEIEEKMNKLSILIKQAEQLEKDLKEKESKEKSANEQLIDVEKQIIQAQHKKDESSANVLRAQKQLQEISGNYDGLKDIVIAALKPFDDKNALGGKLDTDLDFLLKSLKTRQKNWQDQEKLKIDIELKLSDHKATKLSLEGILRTLEESMMEKRDVLAKHKADLKNLIVKRTEFYGQKDPDAEEVRLKALVNEKENLEKLARENLDEVKQHLNSLQTLIKSLKENTAIRTPELEASTASFITNCKKAGFDDELVFISHRLSFDEINRLNLRAKSLDEKKADIANQKKDRETKLLSQTAKKLTDEPCDQLQNQQTQTRESLKELGQQIGAIKQKLSENTIAKVRLQEKKGLIDNQKKECLRWDALHSLIGSADGKKYRNFAQGITFEVMVSHANDQLEKMTDRYLLVRDEQQPLELNIVDNYQAGEIRSTKNLSGGESFIVSLSLALGLSNMASRNVRVDSLFLDEGFGTLDEDALETSLEALVSLQQEGKLIGIISHVSSLKERIGTQINIQPVSGGKSTITGPGCSK